MADVLLSSIVQPAESTSQLFGFQSEPAGIAPADGAALKTFSGALTANVLKEMVNVSGSGYIDYLALRRVDGTVRSTRIVLHIDGAVVIDMASSAIAKFGAVQYVVGIGQSLGPPIPFAKSFAVEISSSLTEIDKLTYYIRYRI